jgi:hypothetical protein
VTVRKVDIDTVLGVGFVQLLGLEDELLQDRVIPRDDTKGIKKLRLAE